MTMDLRFDTPLHEAELCGVPIQFMGAIDNSELRLDPGNPIDSQLYVRLSGGGLGKMPPFSIHTDPVAELDAIKQLVHALVVSGVDVGQQAVIAADIQRDDVAPSSIQNASQLSFSEGAAALMPDGTVKLFKLLDGSYVAVP